MQQLVKTVTAASRFIDFIAGFILVSVAGLVVANIFMRTVFNNPIHGTYELVGYLTASAIALSLAHCAVQNSHIAVSFFTERISLNARKIIEIFVNGASVVFLLSASWFLVRHGLNVSASGRVSNTLQIPFHPFIYLLALGFIVLSMVVLLKFFESFKFGGDRS